MIVRVGKGETHKKRALMALLSACSGDLNTEEQKQAGMMCAMQLTTEELDNIFSEDVVVTIVEVKKKAPRFRFK